jgi:ribosomal protein S1
VRGAACRRFAWASTQGELKMKNNESPKTEFESMLAIFPIKDTPAPRSLVTGTVVKKSDKGYWVDLHMKCESFVCEPKGELDNVSVGCSYQFMVVGPMDENGSVPLSRSETRAWHELDTMRQLETVSLVTVKSISTSRNGRECGLNTTLCGVKAFIPKSEIPARQKLNELLDQEIAVCVIELDILQEPNGVVILSHSKALEAIFLQQVESFSPSATVRCQVVKVMDAGARVRLVSNGSCGLMGFVPRSELAFNRKANPFEIIERGDLFDAQILTIDMEAQNIVLSRRQSIQTQFLSGILAGQKIKGRISRSTEYAFYVEVGNCLDAILYRRDLNKSASNCKDSLKPGTEIDATVISVKPKEQKLVLAIR